VRPPAAAKPFLDSIEQYFGSARSGE